MKWYFYLLWLIVSISNSFSQDKNPFLEKYVKEDFQGALQHLDKDKKILKEKNKLLYNLQRAIVLQALNNFSESNISFEEAFNYIQDYRKSIANDVFATFTSPNTKPYKGEDFEIVLIPYYKALNYLRLKQYEEALVECRRIHVKLSEFNDLYETRKNRYKRDAFVENLTGIIYEASGDINNAFISYRNAFNTYQEDYKKHFGVEPPLQLKKDLLRTAHHLSFTDELEKYEKLTNLKHQETDKTPELVFFWHNGLAPVKKQWAITFIIVKGVGGAVSFVNEEMGLVIPYASGGADNQLQFSDLKFIRVAFPKYVERKPYYRSAEINLNNKKYPLEMGENINEIAFKTLEDRMIRELSSGLLRLVVKQESEALLRKQNQNLGALLSITNAITEKADTRNWQTLPYFISYARIPLEPKENKMVFTAHSPLKSQNKSNNFTFTPNQGETIFFVHHSLLTLPISP